MERQNTPQEESGIYNQWKEDSSLQSKIIWLYGPDIRETNRAALNLLNNWSNNFDPIRVRLGLAMDLPVLPLFTFTRRRAHTIQKFIELDEVSLLIVGDKQDQEDEDIQALYKYGECVYFHPEETQFHIRNMKVDDPPTYSEVRAAKEQWKTYLADHFNQVEIIQ